MATVDKSSPIPRYEQVRQFLLDQIGTGRYAPGDRIPGERELAVDLDVSQMTVNKAILALVESGCLYREHGRGTYVRADYQPPRPANLRIGVVLHVNALGAVAEDYYMGALFRGIQRVVANTPHTLSLLEAPADRLYECMVDEDIDGFVLLAGNRASLPGIRKLVDAGKRIVALGMTWDDLPCPSVDSDNVGGTRQAIEHLWSLGHERIAGLFGFAAQSNTQHRMQVFQTMAGAPEAAPLIVCKNVWVAQGEEHDALLRMLTSEPRPTAVFAGGYQLSLDLLSAAREAGVRVPDDLSVVGYDDPESASHLTPPLTTIRQPLEEMGRRAMESLVRWAVADQRPPLRTPIAVDLLVRGSTAAPPRAPHDGRPTGDVAPGVDADAPV